MVVFLSGDEGWANIILSIFWASIWIIDMIEGGLLLAQYLINVSMIVVVALIVWYAWKWPNRKRDLWKNLPD